MKDKMIYPKTLECRGIIFNIEYDEEVETFFGGGITSNQDYICFYTKDSMRLLTEVEKCVNDYLSFMKEVNINGNLKDNWYNKKSNINKTKKDE